MPIAPVNGQNIFYEDTGGEGPAIVFSHGLFMDHTMFAPQVAALRDRYRCIAWDERGHGGTATGVLAPFTYYDSADDLAALLGHLGIGRAILVGMSQGGFLSLRCALTHPDLVRALILLDSQAGCEEADHLALYHLLANQWIENGLSQETADFVAGRILGDGWSGTAAWQDKWRRWAPGDVAGCMAALAGRDDITRRLGEIAVPSLVVHGEADTAIPMQRGEILAEGLRSAELVRIPGAGHAANLTHPGPVNAAIEDFLRRLPA
jgi:pimeloyl-ACP methyl ester carboxylesterase